MDSTHSPSVGHPACLELLPSQITLQTSLHVSQMKCRDISLGLYLSGLPGASWAIDAIGATPTSPCLTTGQASLTANGKHLPSRSQQP